MTRAGLTFKQAECLDFIEKYEAETGCPPSFAEMMEALGLRSKSGVHRLIVALEERGHIERLPYRARAIRTLSSRSAGGVFVPFSDLELDVLKERAAAVTNGDIGEYVRFQIFWPLSSRGAA